MFISIKNQKNFPKEHVSEISRYLLSKDFIDQLKYDIENKNDDYTRKIIKLSDDLFIIRYGEFSIPDINVEELHIISSDKYGLLDLYHVGTDANKTSILYWIIKSNAKHTLNTDMGMVAKNVERNNENPKLLGRFDHIWIASTKSSTALALDMGSSHLVT
jgi:hypothetical protein